VRRHAFPRFPRPAGRRVWSTYRRLLVVGDKGRWQLNTRPIIPIGIHGKDCEGGGAVFVAATTSESDADRIDADDAVRGPSYYCPACHTPVDYKVGPHVVAHFAHRAGASDCPKATGDSRRHMDMKRQMRAFFERRYRARVEYEVPFMKGVEDRYAHYADLVVELPNGFKFVCECQHSAIKQADWERRTGDYSCARDYGRDGWPVLWVWDSTHLCTDAEGGDDFTSDLWLDREREVTVPAEVLRCHDIGHKKVYGLDARGRFRVVHYEPIKRHNAYMGWDTTLKETKTLLVRDFDWWRPIMQEDEATGLQMVSMGGAKGAWWRLEEVETPAAQPTILGPTPLPSEPTRRATPARVAAAVPTPASRPTPIPAPQASPTLRTTPIPAPPVYANHSRQVRRPSLVPGVAAAIIALALCIIIILALTGQLHLHL